METKIVTPPADKPRGLARAARDDEDHKRWQAERSNMEELQSCQAAHAAKCRIERIARREPAVDELLSEYNGLKAAHAALTEKFTALEAELARVGADNGSLLIRAETAEQALALSRADVQRLMGELEKMRVERDKFEQESLSFAGRIGDNDEDLAASGRKVEQLTADVAAKDTEIARLKAELTAALGAKPKKA